MYIKYEDKFLRAEKFFSYLSAFLHRISMEKIQDELKEKNKEWWKSMENKELLLENACKLRRAKARRVFCLGGVAE